MISFNLIDNNKENLTSEPSAMSSLLKDDTERGLRLGFASLILVFSLLPFSFSRAVKKDERWKKGKKERKKKRIFHLLLSAFKLNAGADVDFQFRIFTRSSSLTLTFNNYNVTTIKSIFYCYFTQRKQKKILLVRLFCHSCSLWYKVQKFGIVLLNIRKENSIIIKYWKVYKNIWFSFLWTFKIVMYIRCFKIERQFIKVLAYAFCISTIEHIVIILA